MPRRHILTERQRSALFDLPTDELSLLRHYTLGDDDLGHIQERRRPENRLGFALQLCALRYPGRALAPGEMIPPEVLSFIGAQLGVPADALLTYATRRQTRQEHMEALREIYGYKTFAGRGARDVRDWLFDQAEEARSNEDLAQRLVARCRETQSILPAVSTIERLCADALVAAELRIETRIAEKLDNNARERLDGLLTELLDANVSRFIWLRQFEVGNNSAAANRLLERLEYHRFRRYAPRMLRCLKLKAASVAQPLIAAAKAIGEMQASPSVTDSFLRPNSKWHRHLRAQDQGDNRLREVAVLFHLRDAFRSGDIWLDHSRRYGDLKQVLVQMTAAQANTRLAVPLDPQVWLTDRKARLADGLKRLARAARDGTIPRGSIEDGTLRIDRLTADVPESAEELILDLYRRMPPVRITDILLEVDAALGFTEAFTHLRTGVPCGDQVGLLNVLLAEGLNLGLRKMAEATNTHDYWQLSRLARWHVESDAMDQALATVVAAQAKLPMSRFWGMGTTASSDGQFFPSARHGEAMNMVNAKYGNEPGLKAYTHVNDQFAPFASQTIPATVSEAPYILDGLLMNEAGRQVREQYADTAGFTDHLFGTSGMLGYRLVLRIRDLPSKRLYVFNPDATPKELRKLVGGKIREELIIANWPDLFRCAATMAAGKIRPSQLLRKLASYPRQNNLAVALREVGRAARAHEALAATELVFGFQPPVLDLAFVPPTV